MATVRREPTSISTALRDATEQSVSLAFRNHFHNSAEHAYWNRLIGRKGTATKLNSCGIVRPIKKVIYIHMYTFRAPSLYAGPD